MPNLYATNKTSSTLTVTSCTVHYIDSTNAELVTVYDGNDVPCDAFQYSLSGVPWWYVLDGVHNAWVNDLSSIGYHLPTVLPTVSISSNTYGTSNVTLHSGSSTGILHTWGGSDWDGATMSWNSDNTYSTTTYTPGDGNRYNSCGVFEPVEVTGYVGAKNISNSSQTFRNFYIAICSSNQATVVTVYDSSNNAYNAFKYTANNTDYYYVLDGTQSDWTDNLAGIGYSLTPTTVKGWFNDDKTPKVLTSGAIGTLKDSSGNRLVYDNTKTYHIYRTVNSSGNNLPNVTLQIDSGYYLGYKNETGQTLYYAVYVEYYTT